MAKYSRHCYPRFLDGVYILMYHQMYHQYIFASWKQDLEYEVESVRIWCPSWKQTPNHQKMIPHVLYWRSQIEPNWRSSFFGGLTFHFMCWVFQYTIWVIEIYMCTYSRQLYTTCIDHHSYDLTSSIWIAKCQFQQDKYTHQKTYAYSTATRLYT